MSTYYKHKRTESTEVPYSFQCEHCMKDSGLLTATITGEAEHSSNFNVLTEKETVKLHERAHANLVKELKTVHKDATEKQIYSTKFRDECPHCHKPQSWGVSGLKNKMFENPIVITLVGAFFSIIAVIGHYFTEEEFMTLQLAAGIFGAGLAIAVIVLIWNIIQINIKAGKAAAGMQKNVPVINWQAVQSMLNE